MPSEAETLSVLINHGRLLKRGLAGSTWAQTNFTRFLNIRAQQLQMLCELSLAGIDKSIINNQITKS